METEKSCPQHFGLCTTCLSSSRTTRPLHGDSLIFVYSALLYREICEAGSIRLCWECEALLRRCVQFRRQADRARSMLQQHAFDQSAEITCLSSLCTTTQSEVSDRLQGAPVDDVSAFKFEPDAALTVKKEESRELSYDSSSSQDSEDVPLSRRATRKRAPTETVDVGIVSATEPPPVPLAPGVCVRMMKKPAMLERRQAMRREEAYVEAPNACEACIVPFYTPKQYAEHMQLVHMPKAGYMRCSVCEVYVERVLLEVHVRRHYATFACTHCTYTHHIEEQVQWHTRSCDGRAPLSATAAPGDSQHPCEQCSKIFRTRAHMKAHVVRQHSGPRACGKCGKVLATTQALWLHMQMEHKDLDKRPCPVCGKLLPGAFRLKQHMRVHKRDPLGVAPHRCEPCNKIFMTEKAYKIHLTSTAKHNTQQELKFKCSACERAFAFKGALYSHYSHYHKKATRLQCHLCSKVLATSASLKRHNERVHEGVREKKDRVCEVCGKYFSASQLKQHMLIHTEERPYACAVCGATFRQRPALYTHNRLVHLNVRRPRAPAAAPAAPPPTDVDYRGSI